MMIHSGMIPENWSDALSATAKEVSGGVQSAGLICTYVRQPNKQLRLRDSMDSITEEIKSRIDIVDLVAETVKLKHTGHSFTGLCPFHSNTKTSAFVVWAETGTWKCFGACNTGGDIFSFVMKRDGLEFREALERLAARAGVELRQMTPAEREKIQTERKRQDAVEGLLTRAAEFFYKQLWTPPPAPPLANTPGEGSKEERQAKGLMFARSRALSDEHLQAARWGWSGADNALFDAIKKADGSLLPLAREIGLLRADGRDFSANAEGDMVSPDGWLIYPHHRGGKVVYFSGRAVSQVDGGDKSRNMPGSRQVYRADGNIISLILPADKLVLVEGPADAESCRAWGLAAWAMCGAPVSDDENGKATLDVLRKRAEHSTLYAAMSNDVAGQRFADKVGELISPLVRIVLWPRAEGDKKSDANDLLKAGGTAEQVFALLEESPTYLDTQVQRASRQRDVKKRATEIEHLAELVAKLDETERRIYVNDIGEQKGLDISRREFERMVAERLPRPEESGTQYQVIRGRMCHMTYDRVGERLPAPLFQGVIRIMGDVVEDDGEEQVRRFEIEGALPDGKPLSKIEVEANEFAQMNWLLNKWGTKAIMTAGGAVKEHLRAAILTLSNDVKTRYDYSHLGWREMDGRKVYLSAAGAVGLDNVRVQVGHDMSFYRLPSSPVNVPDAVRASLRFLNVGTSHATIPLWAAMYLAPLSSIIPPTFTIWLFGTTGSLKSTSTALAMCHYGKFTYNSPPASWTATANALERMTFLCKDTPMWIDDFTAQSTFSGNNELRVKSDQLLRNWGNRTGRNRMQADLKLRKTFIPRGLIISTAEILPPNRSILSRLFAIEFSPDDVTRGDGSALSLAQVNDAPLYPHAMAGYLMWLSERYATLEQELPDRLRAYTERARTEGKHLRLPGNVAEMFIGLEMGLTFARSVDALDQETVDALKEIGWATLVEIGDHQAQDVDSEDPVAMYMVALEEMMAQGSIYLRGKEHQGDEFIMPASLRNRALGAAQMLGWYDKQFWYLMPGATFNAVADFYKRGMTVFPDTERGLRKKLIERGMSLPSDGRMVYQLRLGDEFQWVLRIRKAGNLENLEPIPESDYSDNSDNSDNIKE
jgi:DNA primase catalytic core